MADMKTAPATLFFLLLTAGAPAQTHMDDSLWVASRWGQTLTKVDRCGVVLQTVLNGPSYPTTMARHPNGDLWVLGDAGPGFSILDRNGRHLRRIPTAGKPVTMVFDAQGNGWISMADVGTVEKFSPAGISVAFYMTATPCGLTVDSAGNIWVANCVGPPGQLTRIHAVTGAITVFPLPGPRLALHAVIADLPSPSQPSSLWAIGDRSNQLVKFDINGNFVAAYPVGSAGSGLGWLAVDPDNNLWVTNLTSGDLHKVRGTDGVVLLTIANSPVPYAVTIDTTGNPWTVHTVSATQPAELRKFDRATGALLVRVPLATGALHLTDAAGFQFARLTDRFGDADGDGDPNFAEALNGTSPYDRQSNRNTRLEVAGASRIGGNVQIQVGGAAGGAMVIFFGRGRSTARTFPGVGGELRLDPTQLFGFVLPAAVPSSLPLTIPNDPALNGVALHLQGIHLASSVAFSNETCIMAWR
jgi:streptogramin lyase